MPRLPIRLALFLSAYSPLFALLAWKSRCDGSLWMILAAIALVSVVSLLAIVFIGRDIEGGTLIVKTVQPRDAEVLAYVVTYLLPFLALDLGKTDDLISFIVFMSLLAVIAVTSHTLFVNPLLSLMGYRTYDVSDSSGRGYFLCIRGELKTDDRINPLAVDSYIRFEPWRKNKKKSSMN